MREEARIQIRGDKAALQAAWNSRFDQKIEYGLVVIYKDDPAYVQMRTLFDSLASEHAMTWHERVHLEYTQEELESFEILRWIITGRAGPGDNTYAPVYVEESVCPRCGRIMYRQERNLVLDLSLKEQDFQEIGYFEHDVSRTDVGEIVVSNRVRKLLESQGVPGVTIRSIEDAHRSGEPNGTYFQLVIESEIGGTLPPTRVYQKDWCSGCGRYKEVLLDAMPGSRESQFYFPRSSLPGAGIMRTSEHFGRGPSYTPELVIMQEVYRLLRDSRVSGFWVEPAHLIEG